jgi:hypothetical protein
LPDLVWHTEQRRVSDLTAWDKNPRRLTKKQAEDLKKSLSKFNLMSIPVVDLDDRIVSGHQRVNILKLLKRGNETIDVRLPNRKLTEEEYREANLRENKNTGEWDEDLLAAIDEELLRGVGFNGLDINNIFGLAPPPESGSGKKGTVCPSCGAEI